MRKALAKPNHKQKNIKTMQVHLVSMLMFMSCPSSLVHKLLMLMIVVTCMLALQSTPDNSTPRYLKPRANSNQSSFPMHFLHTFTVILPSVIQTFDNSSIALAWSNFYFPSYHFYTIFLDNSNHVLSAWQVGKKRALKSEIMNLFQNNRVNSLSSLFCHSSSNSLSIPVYFVA